jgi:glycosyltransferase involved in cell wall biosynthesis
VKVSIVTISFNQARFLEAALVSVLSQDHADLEYIVVDPGSTDGSRDIIARYRARLAAVVLEPDRGAADGLNKGFARATGEVYGFLNSDDVLEPGAVSRAVARLRARPAIDVVSGAARIIDAADRGQRIAYSDRFDLRRCAYGACVLIQPSTFFRAAAYSRTGGFNVANRSNWDGELFVDLALAGARFDRCAEVWSRYRVHGESITGSARMDGLIREHGQRMFRRIVGRDRQPGDRLAALGYRLLKALHTPRGVLERLRHGPVYGSASR